MSAQSRIYTSSIEDLIDLLGLEITKKLVQFFGGTDLYVPKKLKAHHKIAKNFPPEEPNMIVRFYGGFTI